MTAFDQLKNQKFNVITVGGDNIELPGNIYHLHFKHIGDFKILNELYSAADLYLLTSREDNLPNVMLEAFANGTPVLAFNTGGMKDWIRPNENGYIVEEISTEALLLRLEEVLNHGVEFNSRVIRDYAIKNFNDSSQTNAYINLYKSLLA
jgi:glycosyltransferase involved in cell wall biosynthesis